MLYIGTRPEPFVDDWLIGRMERVASWRGDSFLGGLAGRPVRLRIALRDADRYSLRFRP